MKTDSGTDQSVSALLQMQVFSLTACCHNHEEVYCCNSLLRMPVDTEIPVCFLCQNLQYCIATILYCLITATAFLKVT